MRETAGENSHAHSALKRWQDELTEMTHIDGEDAPRLTIGQAHPGGLAKLYSEQPTGISLLIREPISHRRARERAAQVLATSEELTARHGVGPIHLSIGQAHWDDNGKRRSSASILRPVSLAYSGDDITMTLLPGAQLDPVLRSALNAQGIDIDAEALVMRATTTHGFSASQALENLREIAGVLEHFELKDDLVVGIFDHPASELLRELEDPRHLFSSDIVRALAGDEEAITFTRQPLPEANPQDRDPWKERGVGDLTPLQQDVVEAVAHGRSLVVDVPVGADETTLVAAILADSGAYGRTVLHIGGSPSRSTRAYDRLLTLGLGEMVTRIDGTSRHATSLTPQLHTVMTDTSAVMDQRELDDIRARLRTSREKLSSYTTYLHRPFRNFGISAFDALQVLTDLTGARPGPSTKVRLKEDTLYGIAIDQGERARTLLHHAAKLGIFSRKTQHSAWRGVVINASEQVSDVLSRVERLAQQSLPQLRVRMSAIAGETGITAATNLVEWEEQLHMFAGVRDVLDIFKPQIFERSAADLVIATASKQWRREHGMTMSRKERTRLVKQAEDFIRPGVHVDDLHKELLLVQERREVWRSYTDDDGWPTLPSRLDEVEELTQRVREDLERLAPMFSTAHPHLDRMNVTLLAELMERLGSDPQGAHELPQRVGVLKELAEIGLDGLVQDLRERHVKAETIDSELDLAWWASILGLMLASEPKLGGFDARNLADTLIEGRALDAQQVESLAPQAISQLRRLRQQAMATRPEQHEELQRQLTRTPTDLELLSRYPLVRHLIPIVLTVPTLVPKLIREGHKVDVLVLEGVDQLPLAELIPLIARARQVVVLEDLGSAREAGAARRLAEVLPTVRMQLSPSRLNDQVALLLVKHNLAHAGVPVPWTVAEAPVNTVWCEGTGMPAPGASSVESTSVEVDAVVELVVAHAMEQPDRSLAVIALNRRHAERIETAIERMRTKEPGLAQFFDEAVAEPFVVVDPAGAQGLSRDRIILTLGFAKTPHGRVIHDFAEISSPRGHLLMADVLRAVRADLTVVSSLRAGEIDRGRLQAQGAQMLLDLLEIAEGQSGDGENTWPILEAQPDRLLIDLADRLYGMGLEVVPNIGIPGGMRIPLAIGHPEAPGRLLVAILTDDDTYVAEPSLRVRDRLWPAMLEEQGWKVYTALSMAVFIDPAREADEIVQLVLDAVDEVNGMNGSPIEVPADAEESIEAALGEEVVEAERARVELDELVESTSQTRQRSDDLAETMTPRVRAADTQSRGPRPGIAVGLPLAAYSDDQLDEMAMWVRSDGQERTDAEVVEELRIALGITRRGFQSDAVLGNVARRTAGGASSSSPVNEQSDAKRDTER